MNLNKSYEFFQPEMCRERIHIIGCGAIGSNVASQLVRLGLTKITLYDMDVVSEHNIANQLYRHADVGRAKVDALRDICLEANPEAETDIRLVPDGWHGQRLSGYVFLCVDNIDLRREIATKFKDNVYIKAMFDFRMRLTDAQHYAADWTNGKMIESFINSMAFTREEAKAETPRSACNMDLSVMPTVQAIVSLGVANFINFVKDGLIKKTILADPFNTALDAFA